MVPKESDVGLPGSFGNSGVSKGKESTNLEGDLGNIFRILINLDKDSYKENPKIFKGP